MTLIELHFQSPHHGPMLARIGTRGAQLVSLQRSMVEFIQPVKQGYPVPWSAGIVMAPWVNRIADGVWTQNGVERQVPINEPKYHNALHGFTGDVEFEVLSQGANFVVLGTQILPTDGYPYLLDYSVEYRLVEEGISVIHRATNRSSEPAPFATGAHPYFVVGKDDLAAATVVVPADTIVETDKRLLPNATVSTVRHRFDLRSGQDVGLLHMDNTYGGLHRGLDGIFHARLSGRRYALDIWQGPEFNYCHVFATREFSGPYGDTLAIAIEPVTGPANNFNSGTDLIWLSPEVEWKGSWGVRILNLGS